MPTYDYRCDANGRVVEVNHPMRDKMKTWGELCSLAGIDTDNTPPNSPVERLANGGQVVKSSSLRQPDLPPCATGEGCSAGGCGFN